MSFRYVAEGIVLKEIHKNPKLKHVMTVKELKVSRKKNEEDLCFLERRTARMIRLLRGLTSFVT